jgi:zinc finger-like protein
VLARGPTAGEQGPLRTLLASWLSSGGDGGDGAGNGGGGGGGGNGGGGNGGGGGGGGGDGTGGDGKRGGESKGSGKSTNNAPPSKRLKTSANKHAGGPLTSPSAPSPIDHIFQFHAALRRELQRLEADVLALPPPEVRALYNWL